jgi:hypothetical protein
VRIWGAVLLLGVGFAAGAASWVVGVGTPVQAQAMPQTPESRFIIGPPEHVSLGTVRFMRDKRTQDCFLVTMSGSSVAAVTPVQSAACQGL